MDILTKQKFRKKKESTWFHQVPWQEHFHLSARKFWNLLKSKFFRDATPSFILIEYKGSASTLTLYVYKFVDGQMDIGQTDIIKGGKMMVSVQQEEGSEEDEEGGE